VSLTTAARAPDQLCAIVSGHRDRTFLVPSTPRSRSWHALRPEMFKSTKWPKTASEDLGTLEAAVTRRTRALRGHRVIWCDSAWPRPRAGAPHPAPCRARRATRGPFAGAIGTRARPGHAPAVPPRRRHQAATAGVRSESPRERFCGFALYSRPASNAAVKRALVACGGQTGSPAQSWRRAPWPSWRQHKLGWAVRFPGLDMSAIAPRPGALLRHPVAKCGIQDCVCEVRTPAAEPSQRHLSALLCKRASSSAGRPVALF
jgi:hypothetical protein